MGYQAWLYAFYIQYNFLTIKYLDFLKKKHKLILIDFGDLNVKNALK